MNYPGIELIQLTIYVQFPEIDTVRLATQSTSENIDSNQFMVQVGSYSIQIKRASSQSRAQVWSTAAATREWRPKLFTNVSLR